MSNASNGSKDQHGPQAKLKEHMEILAQALPDFEREHPHIRAEVLLWLIENSLHGLQNHIATSNQPQVAWDSPFLELHYPVECNFELWGTEQKRTISLIAGNFTLADTADPTTARKKLAQILVKQVTICALKDFTNNAAFEKRTDTYTPILDEEMNEFVSKIKSKKKRKEVFEELFRPFSMGAPRIDIEEKYLVPNAEIPESVAKQLSKMDELIDVPALEFHAKLNDHPLRISVIFQIHPLILDVEERRAYFPLTIGLLIVPNGNVHASQMSALANELWTNPANWSAEDQSMLWKSLLAALDELYKALAPSLVVPEIKEAVIKVNAEIRVQDTGCNSINSIMGKMADRFAEMGQILAFNCQVNDVAPEALTAENSLFALEKLLERVDAAQTSDEKGKSLERLMTAFFNAIPGFKVTRNRVRTETEEIDLVILNDSEDARFKREQAIILVECKNWCSRCGKDELVLFKEKVWNRKGRCSLGILMSWNGFADTIKKEMLRESHDSALIIPMNGEEIRDGLTQSSASQALLSAWNRAMLI